jgi:transposase InsO family protein
MTADLAANALRAAIARRQPDGVVSIEPDRGAQFCAWSFRTVRGIAGLQRSMARWLDGSMARWVDGSVGSVASAGGNAAMESFWALLQRNVLNSQT